jgi:hypothetical protein
LYHCVPDCAQSDELPMIGAVEIDAMLERGLFISESQFCLSYFVEFVVDEDSEREIAKPQGTV